MINVSAQSKSSGGRIGLHGCLQDEVEGQELDGEGVGLHNANVVPFRLEISSFGFDFRVWICHLQMEIFEKQNKKMFVI